VLVGSERPTPPLRQEERLLRTTVATTLALQRTPSSGSDRCAVHESHPVSSSSRQTTWE